MQSGIRIVCITFSGLLALQALADKVRLHSGSVIQGKVLDVKDDKLQIDSGYGKLNIPLEDTVNADGRLGARDRRNRHALD